jgi:hypothetical protein
MPVQTRIQLRRDSAANWADVVLADGEVGYVSTGANKGNFKIGDGTTAYKNLPFALINPEVVTASTGLQKVGSDISAIFGTEAGTVLSGAHGALTSNVHGVTGSVVGTTDVQDLSNKALINFREKFQVVTGGPASTQNIDTSTASAWYFTASASSVFTLNFRSSSSASLSSVLPVGSAMTVSVFVKNGSTPFHPSSFRVDGATVFPVWQLSLNPEGADANATNVYTFTILKIADGPIAPTYTVLASQTRFD